MSTDTPRTNGFEIVVEGESPVMGNRYRAWAIFSRTLERELAAKDAEIAVERERTATQEHFKDVAYKLMDYWKARAEKAEANVRETYRAWLGRDYQHLELPAAIGKMRADLEAELAAARLDTERLDWLDINQKNWHYLQVNGANMTDDVIFAYKATYSARSAIDAAREAQS